MFMFHTFIVSHLNFCNFSVLQDPTTCTSLPSLFFYWHMFKKFGPLFLFFFKYSGSFWISYDAASGGTGSWPAHNQAYKILPSVGAFISQCLISYMCKFLLSKEKFDESSELILEWPFIFEAAGE